MGPWSSFFVEKKPHSRQLWWSPPNLSYLEAPGGPSFATQKAILGDYAVIMWLQGLSYTVQAVDTWQLRLLLLSVSPLCYCGAHTPGWGAGGD